MSIIRNIINYLIQCAPDYEIVGETLPVKRGYVSFRSNRYIISEQRAFLKVLITFTSLQFHTFNGLPVFCGDPSISFLIPRTLGCLFLVSARAFVEIAARVKLAPSRKHVSRANGGTSLAARYVGEQCFDIEGRSDRYTFFHECFGIVSKGCVSKCWNPVNFEKKRVHR